VSEGQATVTFTLNGKQVTVPKGWTVMQAAKRELVDIPHFCWHEGLSIAGVCRFCMVKVEGRPKLEISCNLQAMDGMIVSTVDPAVKDAHKWALEFHLINHPLDCPICDQAGECSLQDNYMKVGKYHSQMTRPKVLKPKALDVGGDLVLDTERCILCSRCVRFEEEVTKSNALGIFDRGDRAIIGTYPGQKIEHNYTANLVDICPVGAFTSKDFRFKQRVWFLEEKKSICPGCATGCAVDVFGKVETRKFFRLKPRKSDVNGHWMCDKGRHNYVHLNKENRLLYAYSGDEAGGRTKTTTTAALTELANRLANTNAGDVALLVSAQYTNEEYKALFDFLVGQVGIKQVYQWREPTEKRDEFDGLLLRGDQNSNTNGLSQALVAAGLPGGVANQFDQLAGSKPKVVVALAPEIYDSFPSLDGQLRNLAELPFVSLWTLSSSAMAYPFAQLIPTKGFAEKTGTFRNFENDERVLEEAFPPVIKESVDIREAVEVLAEAYGRMSGN
jgi:NADH-quinone oxidoreductase subunit G